MPAVTVMLNTVREKDVYRDDRDTLLCMADDLAKQSFADFEFVAVDGLHAWRADTFERNLYDFDVAHVPPKDCPAVREHVVAIGAYKNTGIAHARGELILTVDDLCWLDREYVERAWRAWKDERLMLAAMFPETGDSRLSLLGADGRFRGPNTPMYGFAAFSTEAALAVNGYDEMLDFSQGLEDCEMGLRLQQAGHRIALDRRHVVRLGPSSTPWDTRCFPADVDRVTKCCQSTLRIQQARGHVRANEKPWTETEWQQQTPCAWFSTSDKRCKVHGHPCAYPDTLAVREHPRLHVLRDSPPVFNLAAERARALAARA